MPVRAGLLLLLALTAAAPMVAQVDPPRAGAAFDVTHYRVALDLDVAAGAIGGREQIDVVITGTTNELAFDGGGLTVDSVKSGSGALAFEQRARRLIVTLPDMARPGERRSLDVAYHGAPRNGLTLLAGSAQAYTTFSTSQWMVGVDAPSERATLDLEVAVPRGWKAAGSGREITRADGPGTTTYRWRQDRDTPSFLFGFVAGTFTDVSDAHGRVALRYLGAPFSADELRRIFRDTAAMLDFFEARAGVPYPGDTYTQALVATSAGQELAGLAHMSEVYGREVLGDAGATSLIAHELAHQWWGDLVTNRDWTHFWLNEGFATFMAAAYAEHARGRDAYLADVERWRTRVQKLRNDGRDRRLVFPDWNRPTTDDRAVVYQKGALALHELRTLIGDAAFWAAVRAYTKTYAGQAVVSADLQRAFETSSGRDLRAFFDEWVHLK